MGVPLPVSSALPSPQVLSNEWDAQLGHGRLVARLPCADSAALAGDGAYMLFAVADWVPSTRAFWIRLETAAGGPGAGCVTQVRCGCALEGTNERKTYARCQACV
jgi:hypothetical protein